jgi:hypothetical protein
MRLFPDKDTARQYVDLLVASKDTPFVFDLLVKDTWLNIKKTFPSVRSVFLSSLKEKGLFDFYMKRVKELGLE